MKNLYILAFISAFLFISCKQEKKKNMAPEAEPEMAFNSFGEKISSENFISSEEMEAYFEELKPGDTLQISFKGTVNSVCKNKGCWMQVDLPEGEEDVMVKFKDYGFFVPKDIDEKQVVVNGKAYITEVSVEEQRHYAEDNGDSPEEVAAIVEPKRTLSFLADGVLIEKDE
jgi:hypothetical protein